MDVVVWLSIAIHHPTKPELSDIDRDFDVEHNFIDLTKNSVEKGKKHIHPLSENNSSKFLIQNSFHHLKQHHIRLFQLNIVVDCLVTISSPVSLILSRFQEETISAATVSQCHYIQNC